MSQTIIGIDLGTTNSSAAVFTNGVVEIIRNERGDRTTPSIVTYAGDEILVGHQAKIQSAKYLTNSIYEFKRLIGQQFNDPKVQKDVTSFFYKVVNKNGSPFIQVDYKNQKKTVPPEELSALVITNMKEISETQLGQKISRAVITIPAYFNDSQRQATIAAGTIAGFETVNIINEPTAAALAFNHARPKKFKRNVLVYDFGGGTFDVSVVTIANGVCTVKATDGDCHLGGKDIDTQLMNYVKSKYPKLFYNSRDLDFRLARLKNVCEKAKKNLSYSAVVDCELDSFCDGQDISLAISRAVMESISKKIFERTMTIVEACLKASSLAKSDIDEVLLVGGCSRIPKVRQLLHDFFDKKELNEILNPDEAVAYGAAVFAGGLLADKDIVEDVTALSLGTDLTNDKMSVIIPRNTPIPTIFHKKYHTVNDNQKEMHFSVFQGEDELATKNHKLGQFTMTGLSPGLAGKVVVVAAYELDKEGILKIIAFEAGDQNNRKHIQIDMNKNGLSEADIQMKIQEFVEYNGDKDRKKKFVESKMELETLCWDLKGRGDQNCQLVCDDVLKRLEELSLDNEFEIVALRASLPSSSK